MKNWYLEKQFNKNMVNKKSGTSNGPDFLFYKPIKITAINSPIPLWEVYLIGQSTDMILYFVNTKAWSSF